MSGRWTSDIIGTLRGARIVINALWKHQENCVKHTIKHSSVVSEAEQKLENVKQTLSNIDPSKVPVSFKFQLKKKNL